MLPEATTAFLLIFMVSDTLCQNLCKKVDGIYKEGDGRFRVYNGENERLVTLTSGKVLPGSLIERDKTVLPGNGSVVTAVVKGAGDKVYLFHESKMLDVKSQTDYEVSSMYPLGLKVTSVKGAAYIPKRNVTRFLVEGTSQANKLEPKGFQIELTTPKITFISRVESPNEAHNEIAFVRSDTSKDYFIVFWGSAGQGQYWAEQSVSSSTSEQERMIKFDMEKYDYRPVSHWVGCIQDFCIEGQVDAALYNPSNNKTYFYRERNLISVSGISSSSMYQNLGGIEPVDAAFMMNNKDYKVIGDRIVPKYDGKEIVGDVFPQLKTKVIDAILIKDENVHIFSGKDVFIYFIKVDKQFSFGGKTLINDTWPTVWSRLDAAVYNSFEKASYFFKGDFHIRFHDTTGPEPAKLNQGNLWTCLDHHYSDTMSTLFNVNGYNDFVKVIQPIRMKKLQESIRFYEDEDVISSSGTKKPETKSSNAVIVIVVIMIVILIIGIIAAIVVCCIKKKKPAEAPAPAKEPSNSSTSSSTTRNVAST